MKQLASAPPPDGSFGALLQAFRHRAYLSQEQLAARAELSERTVRNLEAGRVRSPRTTTVRLLADALELAEPERKSWLAAALEANGQPAEPGPPGAGARARDRCLGHRCRSERLRLRDRLPDRQSSRACLGGALWRGDAARYL